jgi:hypothetical protein
MIQPEAGGGDWGYTPFAGPGTPAGALAGNDFTVDLWLPPDVFDTGGVQGFEFFASEASQGTPNLGVIIRQRDDDVTLNGIFPPDTDTGNIAEGYDITGQTVHVRHVSVGGTVTREFSVDGDETWTNLVTQAVTGADDGYAGTTGWYGGSTGYKIIAWAVDNAGTVVDYDGGLGNDVAGGGWGNDIIGFDAAAASSTVSRAGGSAAPYPTGAASWTVTFSEPVSGVTAGSFSLVLGGNTATDALVFVDNGDNSFTLSTNITAGDQAGGASLGLAFDNAGVTTTAGGVAPAAIDGSSNAYAAVPSLPAANTLALLAMGMLLALAAAFVIRKQAMNS